MTNKILLGHSATTATQTRWPLPATWAEEDDVARAIAVARDPNADEIMGFVLADALACLADEVERLRGLTSD